MDIDVVAGHHSVRTNGAEGEIKTSDRDRQGCRGAAACVAGGHGVDGGGAGDVGFSGDDAGGGVQVQPRRQGWADGIQGSRAATAARVIGDRHAHRVGRRTGAVAQRRG
ncbi:MAG: hypothetical protein WCG35_11500, partial [Betaproteobacteria bacterium]